MEKPFSAIEYTGNETIVRAPSEFGPFLFSLAQGLNRVYLAGYEQGVIDEKEREAEHG